MHVAPQVYASSKCAYHEGRKSDKNRKPDNISIRHGDNLDTEKEGDKKQLLKATTIVSSISPHGTPELRAASGNEAGKKDTESAEAIRVGDRVKVLYEETWYEGTVKATPDVSDRKSYEVQCDSDDIGVTTFAHHPGKDIVKLLQAARARRGSALAATVARKAVAKVQLVEDPPTAKAFALTNRGRTRSATGQWFTDLTQEVRVITTGDFLQIVFLLILGFLFLFVFVEGLVFCMFRPEDTKNVS